MQMEIPEAMKVLLGLIAPLIIQFVTMRVKGKIYRFLIAIVLSGVTGIAAMLWQGVSLEFTVEFISLWYLVTQLAFHLFWQPLFKKNEVMLGVKASVR
jgi:hypothetical protein